MTSGKLAVIVGGSRGIGYGIASHLHARGTPILLVARNEEALSTAQKTIRNLSGGNTPCEVLVGDIHNEGLAKDVLDVAASHKMELGVAICSQSGPKMGAPSSLSTAALHDAVHSYLIAPITFSQIVSQEMTRNGFGRVIHITSSLGVSPSVEMALSSVTRSALHTWVRLSARELAGSGVTINAVAPHAVFTERTLSLLEDQSRLSGRTVEEMQHQAMSRLPYGRWATPEEVASVTAFLASDTASYITGAVITVDGAALTNP